MKTLSLRHAAPIRLAAAFFLLAVVSLTTPVQSGNLALAPGDTALLMSDGLPEMLDPDGEVFGYERVGATLREARSLGPQEIVDHFARAASRWTGRRPPEDDITLVVLRRRVA